MPYFRFRSDIHCEYGIDEYPALPRDISFVAGRIIAQSLTQPLVFGVTNPPDRPPVHLLGAMIPVASVQLIEALNASGVDNLQTFPAVLRNFTTGQEWSEYAAINILGLLDAADMSASAYGTIIEGDSLPPLASFTEIVLIHSIVRGHLVFRIVQSPVDMFMSDSVLAGLAVRKPRDGWGISAREVKSL